MSVSAGCYSGVNGMWLRDWGPWGRPRVPGVVSGGWGTGLPGDGVLCQGQSGSDPSDGCSRAPGWKPALVSLLGLLCCCVLLAAKRMWGSAEESLVPPTPPPAKPRLNTWGVVMTAAFYSFFPLVPCLRWWWIFHPLTLQRRCMLATCGLLSLEKVCADCSNLQVMMFWGESRLLGGVGLFDWIYAIPVYMLWFVLVFFYKHITNNPLCVVRY